MNSADQPKHAAESAAQIVQQQAHWPYPRWIAHRGAGRQAPENTLAAMRHGAALGYRMFECDAKLSADGQVFLLHDTTLDRTAAVQAIAGELSWNSLARLDVGSWHSPDYAGEPLPRLEQIVNFALKRGLALNVEIKPTPGVEAATGEQVASLLAQCWPDDRPPPLLTSFKPAALAAARQAAPQLPRGLLLDSLWNAEQGGEGLDWLDSARALDCVAVVTQHRLMTAELFAQLRQARLHALCYTVNEATDVERLLALGVDGLITDEVQRWRPD
jgi:glycerophosphoryl diester phosphodiesterase